MHSFRRSLLGLGGIAVALAAGGDVLQNLPEHRGDALGMSRTLAGSGELPIEHVAGPVVLRADDNQIIEPAALPGGVNDPVAVIALVTETDARELLQEVIEQNMHSRSRGLAAPSFR